VGKRTVEDAKNRFPEIASILEFPLDAHLGNRFVRVHRHALE
jgi:hypothetical protein